MKSLVFDTGPVISLTMNNLLWLLKELKKKFKGEFYISTSSKEELVDHPLSTKRFEFEALQVLKIINEGTLKVLEDKEVEKKTNILLDLANSIFNAYGKNIRIVHKAEMQGLALCINLKADAFVVDERTSRLLIEDYSRLKNILEKKLHTRIKVNNNNLKEFQKITKGVKIIRSIELVTAAFELGLLNSYILNIKDAKKKLLDSVLWGVKLDGCAVSKNEIEEIMKLVK